mgnify:CR=1 FL=1
MAKSNKNNQLKLTKALDALISEAKNEGVNLKGLRITNDNNALINKQYCESRGMKLKCVKKANGTTHCYCVL